MLYAVIATALARLFGGEGTLGGVMERAIFFNDAERTILARGIGQVRAIAEIVGRAKMQASAAGIEFAKPDDAAKRLNPKRAFKLHPRKALAYFRKLSPRRRLPLSQEWLDAHRIAAFRMAEVTEATVLKRVHSLVYDAIEEGKITTRDFKVSLEDLGVTSKNPQYAEMVFRTNALDSYNTGYYEEVRDDPDLGEYFPYWEYLVVDDDRLSDEHRAHVSEGEGGGPYFPASRSFDNVRGGRVFNCRCSFRWVDKYEAEELGLTA